MNNLTSINILYCSSSFIFNLVFVKSNNWQHNPVWVGAWKTNLSCLCVSDKTLLRLNDRRQNEHSTTSTFRTYVSVISKECTNAQKYIFQYLGHPFKFFIFCQGLRFRKIFACRRCWRNKNFNHQKIGGGIIGIKKEMICNRLSFLNISLLPRKVYFSISMTTIFVEIRVVSKLLCKNIIFSIDFHFDWMKTKMNTKWLSISFTSFNHISSPVIIVMRNVLIRTPFE